MRFISAGFVFSALMAGRAAASTTIAPAAPGWTLVQNGTTGIVAIELMVVSPTLGILFQRAANDPLQINGHSAWGALWDFRTNTASPLDLATNAFCGAGGFLSNGTVAVVSGHPVDIFEPPMPPAPPGAADGRMGVRMFEPCTTPDGAGCEIYDDPEVLHLVENRWYPTTVRVHDGSIMVIGGNEDLAPFYNEPNAVNNIEFVPPKDNNVPRHSPFLVRTLPANMFPRAFALPDGKILMIANNGAMIYDMENDTEQALPDLPNGVRVTNPFDGTAVLLPLSPPHYTPEVFVCGGSHVSDKIPPAQLTKQDPASDQCSRLVLTKEGIKRGWQVEKMLEGRMIPEMILLPNGQVTIVSGAKTGYPAIGSVIGAIADGSNADHPAFTPALYTPDAPRGKRFTNRGMPTSKIPRLYHSTATLTPMGNIMLAGNNPHSFVNNQTEFPTEFRVEYLNPPYMHVKRPFVGALPAKLAYNKKVTVPVTIPKGLNVKNLKLALMDLGFSTHGWHSDSRLVWMDAKLSKDQKSITFTTPPNNKVYPPGPAYVYLTVDDISSEGSYTLLGNGLPPPVGFQGVPL
ncbi:glyoxal oxidase precursor [Pterulicium gracile]|uniref:Glyoxal oxidase n=1 Tax=Pterulicium gracile TaxID=1884261 RepID=A0A5C3QMN8_9AGAR|nr:glyoxal oxidase precursor [Pterula gracilis]